MGLGVPIPAAQQLGGSDTAWYCILMDSVLYSPDKGYFAWAGCPNSSEVQQLGGSVLCMHVTCTRVLL